MSYTPRTDAALQAVIDGDCLPKCDSFAHEEMCPNVNGELVMAHFARQLEREVIELQHQLGIVKAILVKVEDERNELLRRLDSELCKDLDNEP